MQEVSEGQAREEETGEKTQTPELVIGACPAQLQGTDSLPIAHPFPSWAHTAVGYLPPEISQCISSWRRCPLPDTVFPCTSDCRPWMGSLDMHGSLSPES